MYHLKVVNLQQQNSSLSDTVAGQQFTITTLQSAKDITDQVLSSLSDKYQEQINKNKDMTRKLNELYKHDQEAKVYLDTTIPGNIIQLLNNKNNKGPSANKPSEHITK